MVHFSRKLNLATISKVSVTPRGEVRLHPGNGRDVSLFLTPKKAFDLGMALIAAAHEARKVRKETDL